MALELRARRTPVALADSAPRRLRAVTPVYVAPRATPAGAVGFGAMGSVALGAIAFGAVAVGALAIGKLAVGRISVGRARIKRLEIDELTVRRLTVLDDGEPPPLGSGKRRREGGFSELNHSHA